MATKAQGRQARNPDPKEASAEKQGGMSNPAPRKAAGKRKAGNDPSAVAVAAGVNAEPQGAKAQMAGSGPAAARDAGSQAAGSQAGESGAGEVQPGRRQAAKPRPAKAPALRRTPAQSASTQSASAPPANAQPAGDSTNAPPATGQSANAQSAGAGSEKEQSASAQPATARKAPARRTGGKRDLSLVAAQPDEAGMTTGALNVDEAQAAATGGGVTPAAVAEALELPDTGAAALRAAAAGTAGRESGAVQARERNAPASQPATRSGPFTLPGPMLLSPQRLAELQTEYLSRLQALMTGGLASEPADRRFASDAWRSGPFGWAANLYLLNSEFMTKLAESVEGDQHMQERVRFATQQWVDAMSPANYLATNPEAQRRVLESGGESLMQGVAHMLEDLKKGRITHTDESAFEVGRNMATTPGNVVFQNELFQLIQYTPTTPEVARRPLVMVPPCINKFYILDLQPANSLVAWAVSQGYTVFMVSWKNIGPPQQKVTWDDYVEKGVIEALRKAREITDAERVNVLGFCVGGTLLASALAVMAGRGERWIESLTLLTTFLDFSEPGVLGVFIDENFVAYRERTIGNGGIMPGRELATTFSYLRPNDLVWNYVVSKYLKGEDPPPFDLLYWNADSTNLPGPMFCWYLRHTYLQNELRIPGRLSNCGVPIDLGKIDVPTYLYGSREDHIVPWHGAYQSTGLLSGPLRFVLGASGHIAGVINPPAANKRNYWTNESLPQAPADWFATATKHPGSWWTDWGRWLGQFGGGTQPAPSRPGNDTYPPLEPAPGSYVKEKAE